MNIFSWLAFQVINLIQMFFAAFGITLHSVYEDEKYKYKVIQVDITQLVLVSIFFTLATLFFSQLFKFFLK